VNVPAVPGSYLVIGSLDNEIFLGSGPFSGHALLQGHYIYSGSACGPGGLLSRISRHLNPESKKFWHFDHLKANLCFEEVIFSVNRFNQECDFIKIVQMMEGVTFPLPLFGSSDCQQKCPAHLARFPISFAIATVFQKLSDNGFDLKRLTLG
jgi:Uri superfamily endonuclease